MKILVVGDPHGEIKKVSDKNIDLVLITGDLGKATFARKHFFDNIKRKQQGLDEKDYSKKERRDVVLEVHNSTLKVLKYFSRIAPTYTLEGNVSIYGKKDVKEEQEDYGVKAPNTINKIKYLKNVSLIKNKVRNINKLKIGFLEYFTDPCWIKEFKPSDYNKKLKLANKDAVKARKVLKNFKKLDILVCHQPPYSILDKVSSKYNPPKNWIGKHAGSKVILEYIKKYSPRYVFCGHIHEGKGKKNIGKTQVYNVGFNGDYVILDVTHK